MQDFLYGLENLIMAEWLFSGVNSEEQIEPSAPGCFRASGAAFPSAINLAVPQWHLLDKLALVKETVKNHERSLRYEIRDLFRKFNWSIEANIYFIQVLNFANMFFFK